MRSGLVTQYVLGYSLSLHVTRVCEAQLSGAQQGGHTAAEGGWLYVRTPVEAPVLVPFSSACSLYPSSAGCCWCAACGRLAAGGAIAVTAGFGLPACIYVRGAFLGRAFTAVNSSAVGTAAAGPSPVPAAPPPLRALRSSLRSFRDLRSPAA